MNTRYIFTFAATILILVGCGKGEGPQQISEVRKVQAPSAPADKEASSAERFGFAQTPPGTSPHGDMTQPKFEWQTPSGWKEQPPTPLRLANLSIGENAEAECYLTVLQGTGGGAAANINRWRTQMSQPEISAEELAKLPTRTVLG
ncbi:MAG: hypothetical protein HY706_01660, partial [Candidatus Hydrogenedentes bacterium]|nr:hypothetical protein [Candidatus Hydrogenedentota bacterium]